MFSGKERHTAVDISEELGGLSMAAELEAEPLPPKGYEANDVNLLLDTTDREETRAPIHNTGSAYKAPDYDATTAIISVPGLPAYDPIDDLLGLGLSVPRPPALTLNPKAALDPGSFQRKWSQLSISSSQEFEMEPRGVVALVAPQSLLRHMQGHHIQCIASGGQPPCFKFFFYAQREGQSASFFLVECLVNSSTAKVQVKIKADDSAAAGDFGSLFQTALSKFGV